MVGNDDAAAQPNGLVQHVAGNVKRHKDAVGRVIKVKHDAAGVALQSGIDRRDAVGHGKQLFGSYHGSLLSVILKHTVCFMENAGSVYGKARGFRLP